MENTLTLVLFTVAALSPLLTFSHLWQVKEWRIDRLIDHLRSEGCLHQLLGTTRLPIVAVATLASAAGMLSAAKATQASLVLLAVVSGTQWILRRQPRPVWTSKAKMISGGGFFLSVALALILMMNATPLRIALLPVLVLLQPLMIILAWGVLLPIDTFLKRRTLRRARTLRGRFPEIAVIGVTGSMGKTTTKELIACALGDAAIATPTYVNTELGVARWITGQLAGSDQRFVQQKETSAFSDAVEKPNAIRPPPPATPPSRIFVIEMGAYRKGEIALLCSFAKPRFGVITAIGTQHIALFGSPENLLSAKSELVDALPSDGRAFLNIDSTLVQKLAARSPCPVTTVSTGGASDCEAFDIEETPRGIRFRVGDTLFALRLHGTHNVSNVLLAIAVAEYLGLTRAVIAERLARFAPLRETFFVEEVEGVTVLNDTHNCSPESAAAAVRWAEDHSATEKILLTSGIIEQGEATQRVHRALGEHARHVFGRVIFLNKKFAQFFAQGYEKNVELFSKESTPVKYGALLVCLGRMPRSTIERLLPSP